MEGRRKRKNPRKAREEIDYEVQNYEEYSQNSSKQNTGIISFKKYKGKDEKVIDKKQESIRLLNEANADLGAIAELLAKLWEDLHLSGDPQFHLTEEWRFFEKRFKEVQKNFQSEAIRIQKMINSDEIVQIIYEEAKKINLEPRKLKDQLRYSQLVSEIVFDKYIEMPLSFKGMEEESRELRARIERLQTNFPLKNLSNRIERFKDKVKSKMEEPIERYKKKYKDKKQAYKELETNFEALEVAYQENEEELESQTEKCSSLKAKIKKMRKGKDRESSPSPEMVRETRRPDDDDQSEEEDKNEHSTLGINMGEFQRKRLKELEAQGMILSISPRTESAVKAIEYENRKEECKEYKKEDKKKDKNSKETQDEKLKKALVNELKEGKSKGDLFFDPFS